MGDDQDRPTVSVTPAPGGLVARSSSLARRGLALLKASQTPESSAAPNSEEPYSEEDFEDLDARAEAGDVGAQLELSDFCITYWHAREEGMSWLRRAAELGSVGAQCRIGEELRGSSPEEAVSWLLKAAERGHAEAQYILGWMYMMGEGVLEDRVEGYKWLCLASAASPDHRGYTANRDDVQAAWMDSAQVAEAERRAAVWQAAFQRRQSG